MLTIRTAQIDAMSQAQGQPAIMPCERTWVAILLVDEQDNPVPGEKFHIVLPDGSEFDSALDSNGHARYDGIASGQCTVTFPELEIDKWRFDTSGPDE